MRKSKSCDFGELHDSLVMDRIVVGVHRDADREKLLSEENLTLEKAIKICKASEQARNQINSMKNEPLKIEAAKIRNKSHSAGTKPQIKDAKKSTTKAQCTRCGKIHKKRECPAYKKICFACKKEGHFSQVCRIKNVVPSISDVKKDVADECFVVNTVSGKQSISDWYETLEFDNGTKIKFKLDTGEQCNVLSRDLAMKANLEFHNTNVRSLISFSNHKMHVTNESISSVKVKGNNFKTRFMIVEKMVQPILGKDSCVELGLVKRMNAIGLTREILQTGSAEDETGCLKNIKYDIDLIDDPKLEIFPARRVPHAIRERV
ncbi:uncharacterized protein LOC129216327 [Uloborus diversus]|uniref:uncharacterized protein LOC129216327 n=1 Tax=Uloborus diversus TaxID=327109 RepID=UPI00240A4627|nr:uncharacterized protein LOC129216327 [Uloborus diversus]